MKPSGSGGNGSARCLLPGFGKGADGQAVRIDFILLVPVTSDGCALSGNTAVTR